MIEKLVNRKYPDTYYSQHKSIVSLLFNTIWGKLSERETQVTCDMNELLHVEHLEDVSQSLYILLFQLLTFTMKRVTNNETYTEDGTNLAFFENDEIIMEKVNNTVQEITEMIETESQSLSESKLFQENKNLFFRVNELQQKLINSIAKNEEVSSAMSKDVNKLIARNDQLQVKLDNSVDKNSKLQTELNVCRLELKNVTYQLDQFTNPHHDHTECGKNKVIITEAEDDSDVVDSYKNNNKEELENRVGNILSQLSIIEEDLKTTTSQAHELCNLVKIHKVEKQVLKNQVVTLLYNLTNVHEELELAREQSLNHSKLVKLCNAEKGRIQQEFILKLAETQHQLEDYRVKTGQHEDVLNSYKTQIQETENELQSTINKFTYSKEELKNAHNKLADLNSVIKRYDTEKIQLQNEIINLKSNFTKTQEQLQSMKSKNEALNKEKNDCTKTINYLDKKLENVLNKLVNTEKELQSLKKGDEEMLKICETEKEVLQNETVSKIAKTFEDLQSAKNETERQKVIVKTCDDEKNVLEKNLSEEKKVREDKIKGFETLNNSLNNIIKTCENEKNATENNLKSEISKIREQLQTSDKETKKQIETIKSCENGKTEIEKQVTSIKSNFNKKEEELKVVRNTCEKNKNILEKVLSVANSIELLKSGNFDVPFYIVNKDSGLAVGVESAYNIIVTAEKQKNHAGQIWEYKNKMLYNKLNGNVLTIVSDTKLGLSSPAGASNQLWDFKENGIITSHNNRVLDLMNGLIKPGVEVIHYPEHGLANQKFAIKFDDKYFSKC